MVSSGIYRVLAPKQDWLSLSCVGIELSSLVERDRAAIDRVCSSFGPDILLCLHQWGLAPATIDYIANLPFPKVYRFGDEWFRLHYRRRTKHPPWSSQIGTSPFPSPDGVIANSDRLARAVRPLLDMPSIEVIRNGVDLSRFPFVQRSGPGRPSSLLFLGRMVRHKGPDLAIDALSVLLKQGVQATLTMAGATPAYSGTSIDIASVVRANGLEEYVRVLGHMRHEDVPSVLQSHDILLFPSRPRPTSRTMEGCPNVIIEALASGLPIVAVNAAGVDEILCDGGNAALSSTEGPEEIADAVRRLLEEQDLYASINKAALVSRTSLDERHTIGRVEDCLVGALTRSSRRGRRHPPPGATCKETVR